MNRKLIETTVICAFAFSTTQLAAAGAARAGGAVSPYDPQTKKDISTYTPPMSVVVEVKSKGGSFKDAYCPDASASSVKVALQTSVARDGKQLENTRVYAHDIAQFDETFFYFWRDPSFDSDKFFWKAKDGSRNEYDETIKLRERLFTRLTEAGKYQVTIEATVDCGTVNPVGKATVAWDISGPKFQAWQKALAGHVRGAAAKNFMRPASQTNAKLEAQMKKLLKDGGFDVRRLVIISKDWHIQRDPRGKVTHRTIFAEMAYREKDQTFRIREVSFKQDATGAGSWGDLKRFGWGPRNVPTIEANISK